MDAARMLIGFNTGIYETIDLSQWIAANPRDVLATNFGQPAEPFGKFPGPRRLYRRQGWNLIADRAHEMDTGTGAIATVLRRPSAVDRRQRRAQGTRQC